MKQFIKHWLLQVSDKVTCKCTKIMFTMVDFEEVETLAGTLMEILGVTFWPYNKSFIGQACSVKMAGDGLALFLHLRIGHKIQNKNLANIQPSSPHTWSIMHIVPCSFGILSSS